MMEHSFVVRTNKKIVIKLNVKIIWSNTNLTVNFSILKILNDKKCKRTHTHTHGNYVTVSCQ